MVRGLPAEALLWAVRREAEQAALKPTVDQLREREAHYNRAKEAK